MGQSKLEKIQQCVISLTEQKYIQKQQAEKFIRDYIANEYKIKDIDYYIQNQSPDLFMKYFIKHRYPQKSNKPYNNPSLNYSWNENSQLQQNKAKGTKNDHNIGQKIIQTILIDMNQKVNYLLNDVKTIQVCQSSKSCSIIEKIKSMIISQLQIESYRYYCYANGKMKQTNSKILYMYQTETNNKIFQYVQNRYQNQTNEKNRQMNNLNKQNTQQLLSVSSSTYNQQEKQTKIMLQKCTQQKLQKQEQSLQSNPKLINPGLVTQIQGSKSQCLNSQQSAKLINPPNLFNQITKQLYPNSRCFNFQLFDPKTKIHHIIIYEICRQQQYNKWIFSDSLSDIEISHIFFNIFLSFCQYMTVVNRFANYHNNNDNTNNAMNNEQKSIQTCSKTLFTKFTLILIEHILKLSTSKLNKLLCPLKLQKDGKKQLPSYNKVFETKQKILRKVRYWRSIVEKYQNNLANNQGQTRDRENYMDIQAYGKQVGQEILFLDFDQNMQLEFIYTNQNGCDINFSQNLQYLINTINNYPLKTLPINNNKQGSKSYNNIYNTNSKSDRVKQCLITPNSANTLSHFIWEYKKNLAKIKKTYHKIRDNFVMNINQYLTIYVRKNQQLQSNRDYNCNNYFGSNYRNNRIRNNNLNNYGQSDNDADNKQCFSLGIQVKLQQNQKYQYLTQQRIGSQQIQQDKNDDKILIKRIKKQNPQLWDTGWFKHFLKQQDSLGMQKQMQQQQSQKKKQKEKRKNNLKLPKINKQYRISNFKTLYSLQQLRQQIDIDNQNINILEFSNGKLEVFVIKVFSKLEFFRKLSHQRNQFPNFIRQVHLNYQKNNNSFHNFFHAVNVMHTCYLFCKALKNQGLLTQFDKLIIVFSGLCHDVGHTGFTNLFQIARQSNFAITYNNRSPLQNYHASKTFEILRKTQNNFISSLSQKQFKRFRDLVINCILYTDIKQHFSLLKKFQSTKNQIKNDDIRILAGMIVHASDFAGSVKVFQVCKSWSLLVNQQFSKQYQQQGKLGIPQTPFMKDLNKMSVLSKNQMGFLQVIVCPLYKQLSQFYQDQTIINLLKNVQNNIKQWQKLMNSYNKQI